MPGADKTSDLVPAVKTALAGAISPYHTLGFYDQALAQGNHRAIVGGRWDETGRIQMALLQTEGLLPHHHLLDIGAGCLRLGCKAVPYLNPGHYWATDLSGALMRRGYEVELAMKDRLPPEHLIEDADFTFPGVPASITHAIAFAVFTHLPPDYLRRALVSLRMRFPVLEKLLFTIFLAPSPEIALAPLRQPDGVVTHPARAPYHVLMEDVRHMTHTSGFTTTQQPDRLPRGQTLFVAYVV